jgi:hypothetical protein
LPGKNVRRNFIFGITLNELVILLFFLLLLITSLILNDDINKINILEAENEKLKQDIQIYAALKEKVDKYLRENSNASIDIFFNNLVEANELQLQLDDLLKENKKLNEKIAQLEEKIVEWEGIVDSITGNNGSDVKTTKQIISDLISEIEKLKRELETIKGQLGWAEEKLSKYEGGAGYKPCWVTDNTTEYLFAVTIYETYYEVDSAWPEHREIDARELPGLRDFSKGQYDSIQFNTLAKPILDWSNVQDCRHYVKILLGSGTSAQTYYDNQVYVQDYFYPFFPR